MKLKGVHFLNVAKIQVVVTDELKKVQKEEFLATFQKPYYREKNLYIWEWSLFWIKKKVCVFLMCLRFLKNLS